MAEPNLRDFLLQYLQLEALAHIPAQLNRMEQAMSDERTQIQGLSDKVDDLISDVRAARTALEADRANLSDAGQDALDQLTAKIDAFDREVGDADASDVPQPPVEPGDGGAAGGGAGGADDGGAAGGGGDAGDQPTR